MKLKIPNDAYIDSQPNSDWLFNTQSKVLYGDWFIVDCNERAALLISILCLFFVSLLIEKKISSTSSSRTTVVKPRGWDAHIRRMRTMRGEPILVASPKYSSRRKMNHQAKYEILCLT